MGGMVALAYLGLPPADRPVEPHGLVLAATAAGRLAERGVARLLASPATDVLCGLAARAPQRAVRLLTKPVCATLALQVGDHARSTLTALFATACRHGIPRPPPSGSCPACGPTTNPPRSPRSAPRRPSSAAEPTSSPHRPTPATWPPPSPAPHTCTCPWPGTCSFTRPPTPSRTPSAARSPRASAPTRYLQRRFAFPDNGIQRTRRQHDRPKRIVAPLD